MAFGHRALVLRIEPKRSRPKASITCALPGPKQRHRCQRVGRCRHAQAEQAEPALHTPSES